MALNTDYKPLTYLQQYFVDKDTGLPLANGRIYFYKDSARTELKNVYQLTGDPVNYAYTVLPNPLQLTSVGTYADDTGNDIVVYGYPYNEEKKVEYYYVSIQNSSGLVQETRQAVLADLVVPAVLDEIEHFENFLPNGQFSYLMPEIEIGVAYKMPSNKERFTLQKDNGYGTIFIATKDLTAVETLTVQRTTEQLEGNPLNELNLNCTVPGVWDMKRLYFILGDVSSFAGATITASFWGKSAYGEKEVYFSWLQYFGEGYPTIETGYSTHLFITSEGYKLYQVTMLVDPINEKGKGAGNNFTLILNLPLNQIYDLTLTNFSLNLGSIRFPYQYKTMQEITSIVRGNLYPAMPPISSASGTFHAPDWSNAMGFLSQDGYAVTLKRDYLNTWTAPQGNISNNSIANIEYSPPIPVGCTLDWWGSNDVPGYKLCDGRALPTAKYINLAKHFYDIGVNDEPIFGTGSTVIPTYVTGTATVNMVNTSIGTVIDPTDNGTGVTVVTTQSGTTTVKLKYYITFIAASAIDTAPGRYISLYTTGTATQTTKEYKIYFIKDFIYDETAITNEMIYDVSSIFVYIKSTDTAVQVAVAFGTAMVPTLSFLLPDMRGYVTRYTANGSTRDPDRATRTPRGDGLAGDVPGTTQLGEFKSHIHELQIRSYSPGGGVTAYYKDEDTAMPYKQTFATGGNETRMINRYMNKIIKY